MIAVLAGAVVSTLLWYLGAVVALLATVGIPLGSSGGPPPPSYYVVSLASSVIGAGLGGWVTASIARKRGRRAVVLLALMLVLAALLAFTRPNSNWPAWYAPVLGLLLA
ncbi:MAG: hypothetical protein M3Y31_02600, partial [Gemmatimonadota bacterium]|nr:hypothetical protein [Gemmatimonadota bacterium]